MHGISRNARAHAMILAAHADAHNVAVVAPHFSTRHYPDYQRLGREGRGRRADLALQTIIDDAGRRAGADPDGIYMFGYSGGGQFVHRYAMAYPEQVRAYVVGAAGWYTFPDDRYRFPYGTAGCRRLPGLEFDAGRFLRIPASVFVGKWDIRRDTSLNTSARVDRRQGRTRLERGRRWVSAMNAAARARNLPPVCEFGLVNSAGHHFDSVMQQGGMAEAIYRSLFVREHGASNHAAAPQVSAAGETNGELI